MKEEKLTNLMKLIDENTSAVAVREGRVLELSLYSKGKEYADECYRHLCIENNFPEEVFYKKSGTYRVGNYVSKKEYGAICFIKMYSDLLRWNELLKKMTNEEFAKNYIEVIKDCGVKNANLREFATKLGVMPSCENMLEYKYAQEFYKTNSKLAREATIKKLAKLIKVQEYKKGLGR